MSVYAERSRQTLAASFPQDLVDQAYVLASPEMSCYLPLTEEQRDILRFILRSKKPGSIEERSCLLTVLSEFRKVVEPRNHCVVPYQSEEWKCVCRQHLMLEAWCFTMQFSAADVCAFISEAFAVIRFHSQFRD
eukprot:TRINITY_DN15852_c0_g1_i1.p1 TRINITY_DN15852_c0_g1~~TRINITY_DN15852_c0_g1_i1.p1  ORF type:complete len:134 (-),score=6.10 TRINITY_DN15852_c0_g1_i1:39-440(-)